MVRCEKCLKTSWAKSQQMGVLVQGWRRYAGRVWYGIVWSGAVWYGTLWYGMVWYGMVCMVGYGMV